ncbi:hypothetical protein DO97_00600 [Neosynechococcus sphagnicola sy1]|uniref:Flavin reductase like domain-containing protein n=1 Tax=Neosynechococcus sphagnicola sy1 TaxID=1497020 RepID=A0A098TNX7_9CYAN|nr:flavin reductase family protein [Neosynechococcus sphagnicola]KGF74045.1 hypothetical protein DO97_00600 [Neosynechococcus sphagnicola sy1]
MTLFPVQFFNLTDHEIYVITAAHNGHMSGQVATWVMLTTLVTDQMRVTASLSPLNATCELIHQSRCFVVNLLAEGQHQWLPHFGLQSSREINKFAGITPQLTDTGIPILPGTCGWALCHIGHQVDLGDRILYIADVIAQELSPDRTPLRKNAAFAALPADVMQALATKRVADAHRDRQLMKPLS